MAEPPHDATGLSLCLLPISFRVGVSTSHAIVRIRPDFSVLAFQMPLQREKPVEKGRIPMKKYFTLVCSTGLVVAALAAGQEPLYPPVPIPRTNPTKGSKETIEETKVTTDSGTTKTSSATLIGKVEAYEAGKWIRLSTPGKMESSRSVDLQGKDITAHVNAGVKVNSWASVVEKTDAKGHKTITVEPAKPPAGAQ
jgi:hypothetical protein